MIAKHAFNWCLNHLFGKRIEQGEANGFSCKVDLISLFFIYPIFFFQNDILNHFFCDYLLLDFRLKLLDAIHFGYVYAKNIWFFIYFK